MLRGLFFGSSASRWDISQASHGSSKISDGGGGLPRNVQLLLLHVSSLSTPVCS